MKWKPPFSVQACRNWKPRACGSSAPPTRRVGGSCATSTMGRSSGSSRWLSGHGRLQGRMPRRLPASTPSRTPRCRPAGGSRGTASTCFRVASCRGRRNDAGRAVAAFRAPRSRGGACSTIRSGNARVAGEAQADQGESDGSSGADRLNTTPAAAEEALIRASSVRSRTATWDSVSSPTRST